MYNISKIKYKNINKGSIHNMITMIYDLCYYV